MSPEEVQGVMESFQEDRMGLARTQASLRHRLQDPGLPAIQDPEAQALLQEMVQLQERELALYRQEQEQLLTHLSPSQLLRLYALREQMNRRVQQLRQGRGGPGGPPGGGLGGMGSSDSSWDLTGMPVRAPGLAVDWPPDVFAGAFGEKMSPLRIR
jgi:hypothetical protein